MAHKFVIEQNKAGEYVKFTAKKGVILEPGLPGSVTRG